MENLLLIFLVFFVGFLILLLQLQVQKKKSSLEKRLDMSIPTYARTRQEVLPYEKAMPETLPLTEKVKILAKNTGNIVKNAVDTFVIGPPIAWYQNYQTKYYLQSHPATKGQIVYLKSGLGQTKGSQWRFASDLKSHGKIPYHITPYHELPRQKNIDKSFGEVDKLQKYTHLKDPSKRKDVYSGHSSGADVGIGMAADARTLKHGIKHYQARAPVPSGLEIKTIGQKLVAPIMPNMVHDTVKYSKVARETAVQMNKYLPQKGVKVYVVAGKEDDLAVPKGTVYRHAQGHNLYAPKHEGGSTHFGTSGVNTKTNNDLIDMINRPDRHFKHLTPKSVSAEELKKPFEEAAQYRPAKGEYNPLRKSYHAHKKTH